MDKNYIYSLYERNLEYLYRINHKLLYDKDFIRRIIKKAYINIIYVPSKLLEDEDFYLELFIIINSKNEYSRHKFYILYDKMTVYMKDNIHFLMKLILINSIFFEILIEKECITKKLIIKVIRLYPHFFKILPNEYKKDKELVLSIFKFRDTNIFKYPIYMYDLPNKFKNDLNIIFKVFNSCLNYGNLNSDFYNISKIKRFDLFEFFKKEIDFSFNFEINNVKLINHLILKNSDYQLINLLNKSNNKKNIIDFLFKYKNDKNYYPTDIFFKVVNSFDNKGDIIIHLLKYNNNILNFIKEYEILMNNKHFLKILVKNNYIYKYDTSKNDNINVIVKKSIEVNFKNDNIHYSRKYKNNITKNENLWVSKKIINKLLFYNNKNKKRLLYNHLPFTFFKNFNLRINHLPILTNFIKINHHNFIHYDYYLIKIRFRFHIKEILLHFIKNGCRILKYLDDNFKNNVEIVYYSLKLNIKQIKYANIRFINEFVNQNYDLEKTFEIFHLAK